MVTGTEGQADYFSRATPTKVDSFLSVNVENSQNTNVPSLVYTVVQLLSSSSEEGSQGVPDLAAEAN